MNIREEITHIFKLMIPLAERSRITLINRCDYDLYIHADRNGFREMIINLVDNGIKYGVENGYLQISSESGNEQSHKLIVTDNGVGIPEQCLSKIFDNFYTAEPSHTRNRGGSGVGLYIVKRLTVLHCWELEVKSIEGKGTQFTILTKN